MNPKKMSSDDTDLLQLIDTSRLFEYLRNNHEECRVRTLILHYLEDQYYALQQDNKTLRKQRTIRKKKRVKNVVAMLAENNLCLQKNVSSMQQQLDRVRMPPPPYQKPTTPPTGAHMQSQ